MSTVSRTSIAHGFADAISELRTSWRMRHSVALVVCLLLGVVPLAGSRVPIEEAGAAICVAAAVLGLNVCLGIEGMPSIGHGAFVAIGAVVAASTVNHLAVSVIPATLVGGAAAAGAGALVGLGALRLRAEHVAISSWIGAWLVAVAMNAFPSISGGTRGLPLANSQLALGPGVSFDPSSALLYELSLGLLAVVALCFVSLRAGATGLSLATWRQNPRASRSIGLARFDQRMAAFVMSSLFAGLAGALIVQSIGLFDASAYGPLLSVILLVAVVLGGPGRALGPVVAGMALALVASPLSSIVSTSSSLARWSQLGVGALLLTGVYLGRGHRAAPAVAPSQEDAVPALPLLHQVILTERKVVPRPLDAHDLTKRFGGVTALDDVALAARPGRITAVIGPNGSGKSTLLKVLAGDLQPDGGHITIGNRDVSGASVRDRVRLGIARTPQRTHLFPDLTVEQHVVAGRLLRRRHAGFVRDLLKTPMYRTEARAEVERARSILASFRFQDKAAYPAAQLNGADQRLLMIMMALATDPSVLLLDEPSAGMQTAKKEMLVSLLKELASAGIAIVVVEHDLRLLRTVADVVEVMDAGRVIATGEPAQVLADPNVARAYLGAAPKVTDL